MKKLIYVFTIGLLCILGLTNVSAEGTTSNFDLDLTYGEHEINILEIKTAMVANSNIITDDMKKEIDYLDSTLDIKNFNIEELGTQNVQATLFLTYKNASQALTFTSLEAEISLDIEDKTAPIIKLNTSSSITSIDFGSDFDPMEYFDEAEDDYSDPENITIWYENSVDPNSSGNYEVIYYAMDEAGNIASVAHDFKVKQEQLKYLTYTGATTTTTAFYEAGVTDNGDEKITLDVPLYTQDNNYDYIKSGSSSCGSTISRYGCALVTFAMVADYYNGDVSVSDVNSLGYSSQGCYFGFSSAAAYYGLSYTPLNVPYKTTDALTVLKGMVRSGKPAIIELKKYSNHATHFVVVYGYVTQNGYTSYYIKNPTNGDYDTLNSKLSSYYINKIYYVSN